MDLIPWNNFGYNKKAKIKHFLRILSENRLTIARLHILYDQPWPYRWDRNQVLRWLAAGGYIYLVRIETN